MYRTLQKVGKVSTIKNPSFDFFIMVLHVTNTTKKTKLNVL